MTARIQRRTEIDKPQFGYGWSFAIVDRRLAEIHFEKDRGIFGHCYVKRSEYKTKREQQWIPEDTSRYRFTFRKGIYYDIQRKKKLPSLDLLNCLTRRNTSTS